MFNNIKLSAKLFTLTVHLQGCIKYDYKLTFTNLKTRKNQIKRENLLTNIYNKNYVTPLRNNKSCFASN